MRPQFVLSEIKIGLWRNLTMTVSAVLTVMITLAVLGVGLLFNSQVEHTRAFWYDNIEVSVFLEPEVTGAQRDEIRGTLEGLPEVQEITYESKEVAFERFQELYQDSPDLVANARVEIMPESYRVKLVDPEEVGVVVATMDGRPGVERVVDVERLLGGFFTFVNIVRLAAIVVAVFLLVVAFLLIYNTVRMAAFSRRRETGIMRLVGASNSSIRLPFMLEGALAGFVGSVLAVGVLVAFYRAFIIGQVRPALSDLTTFVGWETVWLISAAMLVVGVAVAALASLVTLQRHLKV